GEQRGEDRGKGGADFRVLGHDGDRAVGVPLDVVFDLGSRSAKSAAAPACRAAAPALLLGLGQRLDAQTNKHSACASRRDFQKGAARNEFLIERFCFHVRFLLIEVPRLMKPVAVTGWRCPLLSRWLRE